MLTVVAALTSGDEREENGSHPRGVASGTVLRHLLAPPVRQGVDAEGEVPLEGKSIEREPEASRGIVPQIAEHHRDYKSHHDGQDVEVLVLPHHPLVAQEVLRDWDISRSIPEDPSHMRPEESPIHPVRIGILVGVRVVQAMLRAPELHRRLPSSRAHDEVEPLHERVSLVPTIGVGIVAMITRTNSD